DVAAEFRGERGEIFEAVVPGEFDGGQRSAVGETEGEGGGLGEDEGVGAFEFDGFDFGGQAELQELVGGIKDVGAPVAQGTVAEIEPGAPVAVGVAAVVPEGFGGGLPGVPVEGF